MFRNTLTNISWKMYCDLSIHICYYTVIFPTTNKITIVQFVLALVGHQYKSIGGDAALQCSFLKKPSKQRKKNYAAKKYTFF